MGPVCCVQNERYHTNEDHGYDECHSFAGESVFADIHADEKLSDLLKLTFRLGIPEKENVFF